MTQPVASADVVFKKAPTIAIGGETGAGKTESALRLARGFVGPKGKFVIIDTEEKRALYKKDRYQPWDWLDFQPPFTPERCAEMLNQCKGYDAVIWDSGSAEYIDEGGLQFLADQNLERLCKGDMSRAEKMTAPAWREPKMRHKAKLMPVIRRYPTLLIVCLRCEPKIRFVKVDGKTQIIDAGYQPICERMFGYDMLVFGLMHADNPGVPVHLKKLEPDLEPVFVPGKQIDESTGERLAAWASNRAATPQASRPPSSSSGSGTPAGHAPIRTRTDILTELCERAAVKIADVLARAEVRHADEMSQEDFDGAVAAINRRLAKQVA